MTTYEVSDFASFKAAIESAGSGDVIKGTGVTITTTETLTLNVADGVKLENLKIDGENITWNIAEFGTMTMDGDSRIVAKTFVGNYSTVKVNIASIKEPNVTYINLSEAVSGVALESTGADFVTGSGTAEMNYDYVLTIPTSTLYVNSAYTQESGSIIEAGKIAGVNCFATVEAALAYAQAQHGAEFNIEVANTKVDTVLDITEAGTYTFTAAEGCELAGFKVANGVNVSFSDTSDITVGSFEVAEDATSNLNVGANTTINSVTNNGTISMDLEDAKVLDEKIKSGSVIIDATDFSGDDVELDFAGDMSSDNVVVNGATGTVGADGKVTISTTVSGGGEGGSENENEFTPAANTLYVFEKASDIPSGLTLGTNAFTSIQEAVNKASTAQKTTIIVADGDYAGDVFFRNNVVGEQKGEIVVKAAGTGATITGCVWLGQHDNHGTSSAIVDVWANPVTFDGFTFDQAVDDGEHYSMHVGDINGLTVKNCTFNGDGNYSIHSNSQNNAKNVEFSDNIFNNAAISISGNFGTGTVFEGGDFNDSRVNIQAGYDVKFNGVTFNATLTDANVDDSFYVIRSNDNGITLDGCKFNIDSTLTDTSVSGKDKWNVLWQRQDGIRKWDVVDCEVNFTDAAVKADINLNMNATSVAGNAADRITFTDLKSTSNNVNDLLGKTTGAAIVVNTNGTPDDSSDDIVKTYTDGKIDFKADADGVYHITNIEEFKAFRDMVNGGKTFAGETVVLDADIDLENEEWEPIGTGSGFCGTFDGNGKTVSNLLITGYKSTVGLFANTYNGEIKNLTVKNAKVSGRLNVGVVAGNPYTSKYTNITVTGHVEVTGMAYVGGVGGKNAYANWTDITVNVDDTSFVRANSVENGSNYRTYVGGVIGFMGEGGHTVKNVTSNIDVFGSTCDIGGIAGIAHYGNTFENVSCSGNVTLETTSEYRDPADAVEVGGIAGVWHDADNVTMKDCQFTGSFNATVDGNADAELLDVFKGNAITGAPYNDGTGAGKLDVDFSELPYQVANGTVELKSTEVTTPKQVIIGTGYGMAFNTTPAEAGASATLIIGKGSKVKGSYVWVGGDYKDASGNKQPEDAANNYHLIVDGGELKTIGGGESIINVRYDGDMVIKNGGKVNVAQLNTKDSVEVTGEGTKLNVSANTTVAGGTSADNSAELIVKDGATASVGRLTVGSTDSEPEYGKVIIGAGSNITASKVTFNTNGSMVISFETANSAKSVTGLDVTGADALDYSKITLVVDGVTYTYQEAAGTMSLRAATVSEAGWYDENGNALLISGEMYNYTVSKGTGNDVILQAIAKPDTVYVNATFTAETAAARGLEFGVNAFATLEAAAATNANQVVVEGSVTAAADGELVLNYTTNPSILSLADGANLTVNKIAGVGFDTDTADHATVDAAETVKVNVSGDNATLNANSVVMQGKSTFNVSNGNTVDLGDAEFADSAKLNVTDGKVVADSLKLEWEFTATGLVAGEEREVQVSVTLVGGAKGKAFPITIAEGATSIKFFTQLYSDGIYNVQVVDPQKDYEDTLYNGIHVHNGTINLVNGDLEVKSLATGAGVVNMDVDSTIKAETLKGQIVNLYDADNNFIGEQDNGALINLQIDSAKLVDGEGDKDVYKLIDITGDGDLKTGNLKVNDAAFQNETMFTEGEAKYNLVQMENDLYLVDDVKFNRGNGWYVGANYTSVGTQIDEKRLVGYNAFADIQTVNDKYNENTAKFGNLVTVDSSTTSYYNDLKGINIQSGVAADKTVTLTNSNTAEWTYIRDGVTVGEGVALDSKYNLFVGDDIQIDGKVNTSSYFHMLWDSSVTMGADAEMTTKGASVIRRDEAADTVDLTINGDDDGQTQFKIESDLGLYNGQVDANNTKIEVRFLNMKDYDAHYQSHVYDYKYNNTAKAELNLNNTDLVMNTTAKSELDGQATINVKNGSTVIAGNIDNAGTINVSGSDFDAKTVVNGTVVMLEMADGLDLTDASTSNRWNLEVTIFDADGEIVFQKAGMSNLQTAMPWIRLFGTDWEFENGVTYYYSIKQNGVELAKNPVDGKGGALLDMTNDVKSGTFNVSGEVELDIDLLKGTVNVADGAVIKDSTIGGGELFVDGNVSFVGDNAVGTLNPGWYNHKITIGEGNSLKADGGRTTLSYGNTIDVDGTIVDAKTADKTAVKKSLDIVAGMSLTGNGNNATLDVDNAYVSFGSTSSKNNKATGNFVLDFNNSIVDFTAEFKLTAPSDAALDPKFQLNVKDSVFNVTKNFGINHVNAVAVFDNSVVNANANFRNAGNFTLQNGSVMTVAGNSDGSAYENTGNFGTLTITGSGTSFDMVNATANASYPFVNMAGAKLNVNDAAEFKVTNFVNNADASVAVGGGKFTATNVTNSGTINVAGESEVDIAKLTGVINLTDGATLTDSAITAAKDSDGNALGFVQAYGDVTVEDSSVTVLRTGYRAAEDVDSTITLKNANIGTLYVGDETVSKSYKAVVDSKSTVGSLYGRTGSEIAINDDLDVTHYWQQKGAAVIDNADVTHQGWKFYLYNNDSDAVASITLKNGATLTATKLANDSLSIGNSGGSDAKGHGALILESGSAAHLTGLKLLNAGSYTIKAEISGGSTLTVDKTISIGTGATVTIDYTSKITAASLTNAGTITIDATGFGTLTDEERAAGVKVIDLNQNGKLTNVQLVNGDGYYLAYGADGDVILTDQTNKKLYVNDAWKTLDDGDITSDGKIVGFNAFGTFEKALQAVTDGGEIVLQGDVDASELSTEIEFDKAIKFTVSGSAVKHELPVVTFQNAKVTVKGAEILIPELDARQNAVITVDDSTVRDAGGNSIIKSYYNGAVNIVNGSTAYTMQTTTMGYITIDNSVLNTTWQTNVYGNGLISVQNGATFNTAALQLTGKDYSGRDNTDAERVGKPAEIVVDNAKLVVGKVYASNGADYSYNSSHGMNIGTIAGKKAVLNAKNNASIEFWGKDGEKVNVGADGAINITDSKLTVDSRAANGTVALENNGLISLNGNSTLKADNITGNGLVAAGYASIDKDALGDRVAAADRTNLTLDVKNIQAWGVRFANANVSFAQDTVFDLVDGANYVYNENASWDLNGNTVKVYGMFIGGGSAGKGGFTLKDGTLVLNTNHFADGSKRTGNITTCFQSYASTISAGAELLVEDTAHFCVYEDLTVRGKVTIEKSGNGTAVGLNDYFFSDGANLVIDGANASFVQKSGNMNIYGEFNDTTGSVADGYAGYIQKSNLTVSNGAEFELTTGSITGNGNITVKGTGSTAKVGGDVAADIIKVNTGATLEVAGTVMGKGTAKINSNGTLKAGNFYGGAMVGTEDKKPAKLIVTGTLDNDDDVLTISYGSTAEIGTLINNYTANVMSGSTLTAGTISNSGNLKVVDRSSLTADKIVNNNVSLKGSTNVKDASLTAGEIENNGLVTIAGESTLTVDTMTASGSKGALMGGWYVGNFADWVSDSNAVADNKLTISSKTAGQAADITQNKISFRDTELTLGSDVNFAINSSNNAIDKHRKFWMGEGSKLNLNDNKMTVKGMFQLEDADVAGTGSLDIYGNDGDADYQYVSFVGEANNINADVNVKNADMVVFYADATNITKNFTIDSVDNGILVGHGTESAYKNAALNVSGEFNAHGKMTVHETSALNVTGTVSVNGNVVNSGTITIDNTASMYVGGNLTLNSDLFIDWTATLTVAGTMKTTFSFANGVAKYGNITADFADYDNTTRKIIDTNGLEGPSFQSQTNDHLVLFNNDYYAVAKASGLRDVLYVDDKYAGLKNGEVAADGKIVGFNAFATIKAAMDAANADDSYRSDADKVTIQLGTIADSFVTGADVKLTEAGEYIVTGGDGDIMPGLFMQTEGGITVKFENAHVSAGKIIAGSGSKLDTKNSIVITDSVIDAGEYSGDGKDGRAWWTMWGDTTVTITDSVIGANIVSNYDANSGSVSGMTLKDANKVANSDYTSADQYLGFAQYYSRMNVATAGTMTVKNSTIITGFFQAADRGIITLDNSVAYVGGSLLIGNVPAASNSWNGGTSEANFRKDLPATMTVTNSTIKNIGWGNGGEGNGLMIGGSKAGKLVLQNSNLLFDDANANQACEDGKIAANGTLIAEDSVITVRNLSNSGKLLVDGSTLTAGTVANNGGVTADGSTVSANKITNAQNAWMYINDSNVTAGEIVNNATIIVNGDTEMTFDEISSTASRTGATSVKEKPETYLSRFMVGYAPMAQAHNGVVTGNGWMDEPDTRVNLKLNSKSGNGIAIDTFRTTFRNTDLTITDDLTISILENSTYGNSYVMFGNGKFDLNGNNATINGMTVFDSMTLTGGYLTINAKSGKASCGQVTFQGDLSTIEEGATLHMTYGDNFSTYGNGGLLIKGKVIVDNVVNEALIGHYDKNVSTGSQMVVDGANASYTQNNGDMRIYGAYAGINKSVLKVQNGGTFTLKNGALLSDGNIELNGGSMYLAGKGNKINGSLTGTSGGNLYVGDYNNADPSYAGASLTLAGTADKPANFDLYSNVYVGTSKEVASGVSEMTVKGNFSTFNVKEGGFYVREDGKLTFDGVTAETGSVYARQINVGGALDIKNSTVDLRNLTAGRDGSKDPAKITMTNATLNVLNQTNNEFTLGYKANRNAEMTLNNSTINSAVDMTVGGSKDGGNTYGKASLSLTNGSTVNATNVNVGIGSTISVMDSTFNANKLNMTADDGQFTIGGSSKVNIQDASFNYIFVKDDTTLTDSYIGGDAVALLGDLDIVDADNSGYGLTVGGLWTGKHMVDGVETNLPDGSKITINGKALKVEGSMLLMHADYDLNAAVDAKNIYFSFGSTVNVNSTVTASSTSWIRGTTNVAAGATFNGVDIVIGDNDTKATLNVAGTLNAKNINLVDNDTLSLSNGNMTVAGDVTVNAGSILSVLNGSTVTVDGNVNVLNPTTGGGLVIMSTGNLQVDYTSTMVIKGSLNFTGLATYRIKADGWAGNTIKVIDTDGGINHDPAVSISNANVVEFNGDVYLTKNTSNAVLYVDDDWANLSVGDVTSDGKIYGFNAFASMAEIADAATDATTGIEIAAGNYLLSSDTLVADNATVTNNGGKVYFKDAVIDVNGYYTGVNGDGSYNEVGGTSKVNIDNLAGYYALRLADDTTLVDGTSIDGSTSVRAKGDLTVGDSATSVVYINSFDNNDSDYTVDNTITVNGTWNISEAGKNYPTYWMGIQGGEGDAVTTLTGDGVINVNTTMILQGSKKGYELGNVVVGEDLEIKTGNIANAHMRFTNVNLTIKGSVENLSTVNSFNAIGSSTVTVTGAKGSLKTASALWIGYTESDFSITDKYASTLTVADGATVAVGEMKINKGNSVVVNAAKLTTDAVTNNGTFAVKGESTLNIASMNGNIDVVADSVINGEIGYASGNIVVADGKDLVINANITGGKAYILNATKYNDNAAASEITINGNVDLYALYAAHGTSYDINGNVDTTYFNIYSTGSMLVDSTSTADVREVANVYGNLDVAGKANITIANITAGKEGNIAGSMTVSGSALIDRLDVGTAVPTDNKAAVAGTGDNTVATLLVEDGASLHLRGGYTSTFAANIGNADYAGVLDVNGGSVTVGNYGENIAGINFNVGAKGSVILRNEAELTFKEDEASSFTNDGTISLDNSKFTMSFTKVESNDIYTAVNNGTINVANGSTFDADFLTNNGTIFVANSTLADQKISGNGYIEAKNSTLTNNTISGQTYVFLVDSIVDGGSFNCADRVCSGYSYAGERLSDSVVTIKNEVSANNWYNYGKLNVTDGATFTVGYYGDTRTGMTTVAAGGKIVADTYRTYNGVIEAGASVEASAALQFYGIDKSVHNATAGYTINGSAVVKHDESMGANLLVGYDKTAEIGGANTVVTVDGANAELKVLGGTHSAVANAIINADDKGNKATLNVINGATFLVEGTLTNKGIINVNGATMDIAKATLTSTGTITVDGEATLNGDFRGNKLTFGGALVLASTSGFTYDTLAALTFGEGSFTFTNADAATKIVTIDDSVVEVGTMEWDKAEVFNANVAGTVKVGTLEMDLTGVSGTASFDIAKGVDSIDTIKFGDKTIAWEALADGSEAANSIGNLVYDAATQTLRYEVTEAGYYNRGIEGAGTLTEVDSAKSYFGGELVSNKSTSKLDSVLSVTTELESKSKTNIYGGVDVDGVRYTVAGEESSVVMNAKSKGITAATVAAGSRIVNGGRFSTSGSYTSLTINAAAAFDEGASLVGGHHIRKGTFSGMGESSVTINAGTYDGVRVIGGNYLQDGTVNYYGDSYVTINGGTFGKTTQVNVYASGYIRSTGDAYTQYGSTYLTITGGTFDKSNIYGATGQEAGAAIKSISIKGNTNIVISGGTFNGNIYGGAYDRCVVEGNTNITLSGSAVINGRLDGDSSNADFYKREFVEGNRTLTFDNYGKLGASAISNFDEVSLLGNSNVELTGSNINLSEVSIWNAEEGSSISGFAKNDLNGDTLALFLTDKKAGSWTVMEGEFGTIEEGFALNIVDGNRPNVGGCVWNGGADKSFTISSTSCTVGWTDSDGDGKKELKITIA